MCAFLLQNGALWDVGLTHCGICEIGLLSCPYKIMWSSKEEKQATLHLLVHVWCCVYGLFKPEHSQSKISFQEGLHANIFHLSCRCCSRLMTPHTSLGQLWWKVIGSLETQQGIGSPNQVGFAYFQTTFIVLVHLQPWRNKIKPNKR